MNTDQEVNQETPARPDSCAQNFATPEVSVFETVDGYVLQAEMPGVNKTGLNLSVDGTQLTIVGHRGPSDVQGEALHRESLAADYRRVFELDPAIDAAKIDAKVDQGVLTIHLPKSERVKPRKITVND